MTRSYPPIFALAASASCALFAFSFPLPEAGAADCSPNFFLRGDVNGDGAINLTDAITITNGLFLGGVMKCRPCADVNLDLTLNITDSTFLINDLFNKPANPMPMFRNCLPCTLPPGNDSTIVKKSCVDSSGNFIPMTNHFIIVNHSYKDFDRYCDAKQATDALIRGFRARNLNVVYVLETPDANDWITEYLTPTCTIPICDGNFYDSTPEFLAHPPIKIDSCVVTVIGGWIVSGQEQCYPRAVCATLENYFKNHPDKSEMVINVPMDAIFMNIFENPQQGPLLKNGYDATKNVPLFFSGSCVRSGKWDVTFLVDPPKPVAGAPNPCDATGTGRKKVTLKCWTSHTKLLDQM